MTREELRDYVDEQRALNNIPYHVYSTLIDGIDTLEQEPFINKPCVSDGACEHDKQKVLKKIRAEIEAIKLEDSPNFCVKAHNDAVDSILEIIDKYKAESEGNISKMGIVEEEENKKIEEYKEVTLEELLALKDKASWSGDTEDDEYQIYHVLPDYEPIKIKKSIVLEYLEKKDKENIHS